MIATEMSKCCTLNFVFLLIFQGGLILFSLNSFGLSDLCIFFIVCFETIVIAWVYGKYLAPAANIELFVSSFL